MDNISGVLHVAASDGFVYSYDLEKEGALIGEMGTIESSDALLSIASISQNCSLAVGGESGEVKLWDLRARSPIGALEYISNNSTGKSSDISPLAWVGCMDVDVDENWIVFGGGSRDTSSGRGKWGLVHIPSRTVTTVVPCEGQLRAIKFHEDQV